MAMIEGEGGRTGRYPRVICARLFVAVGMLTLIFNGRILEALGSYRPIFIVAGAAYLVAIAAIHLLTPSLGRVRIESAGLATRTPS